jgi:Hemolysin-type calcium-binding repeat (2 copies).
MMLGAGADPARGGEGDDDIRAFDGDDEIDGGAGDDVVFGQNGADRIEGGAGLDRLVGGEGGDTFVFADGAEEDRLIDFEAGDLLDFTGVEGVSGIEDLSLTAVDPHVVIKSDADPDLRIVVAFTELEALEDGSAFIFG